MPLMTVERWRDKTSKFLQDRKNPLITDVDILLGEYHKPGKTRVQKLKLVILIRRYCKEWLSCEKDEKDEKDEKEKFSHEHKYVLQLGKETRDELNGADMQQAIQEMKAGKKAATKATDKQLEDANVIELLQPRASAKAKWQLNADLKLSRARWEDVENVWLTTPSKSAIAHTDIIGLLDFITVQQRRGMLARNIEYLQKRERIKCQLFRQQDGTFRRGGRDFAHSTKALSPTITDELYAMDTMEFIYTHQPQDGEMFHHSSFLSGRAVICAGNIRVDQGVIKHIDNGSGHYKPTTQNLLDCVKILQNKHRVNLPCVTIMDYQQQGVNWDSAKRFLDLNGRRLPPPPPPLVKT